MKSTELTAEESTNEFDGNGFAPLIRLAGVTKVFLTDEVATLSFAERARVRNREIGFIFQSFNLIGDLTVFENVELPLTYRGTGASDRKALVTEALERVGMAHRAKHLPSQLY